MIDFNKPLQTRDGREVRVLCTDGPGARPVVGYVDNMPLVYEWAISGKNQSRSEESIHDLINVPETKVVWMNCYPNQGFGCKEAADACANHDREACIRVPYTVDQFDDEGE